jgi:hypothetical protein
MPTYLDRVAAAGARVSFEASPSPAAPPVMPGPRSIGQTTELNHPSPIFSSAYGGVPETAATASKTPDRTRNVAVPMAPHGSSINAEQNNITALPLKESTTQVRQSRSTSVPLSRDSVRESPQSTAPPRPRRQISPTPSLSNVTPSSSQPSNSIQGTQSDIGNPAIKGKTPQEVPRNVPITKSDFVVSSSEKEVEQTSPVQPQVFPKPVDLQPRRSTESSRESSQTIPEVPRATDHPNAVSADRTQPPVAVVANQYPPVLPRVGGTTEPESRITIGRVDVLVTNPLPPPPPAPAIRYQGSNWQDGLRARFLDRFTLRP